MTILELFEQMKSRQQEVKKPAVKKEEIKQCSLKETKAFFEAICKNWSNKNGD